MFPKNIPHKALSITLAHYSSSHFPVKRMRIGIIYELASKIQGQIREPQIRKGGINRKVEMGLAPLEKRRQLVVSDHDIILERNAT